MIYWIFHLLARIYWYDGMRSLTARLIGSRTGSPIASVLANPKTTPIDWLVMSSGHGSSTGIWSLKH
jgi:hypothetical protein